MVEWVNDEPIVGFITRIKSFLTRKYTNSRKGHEKSLLRFVPGTV